MDLKSLKAEQHTVVEIVDPLGEPTDIRITVAGSDSDVYREAQKEQSKAAIARASRGGRRSQMPNPDEMEARALDFLASCTVDWRGMEEDGVAVPFSAAAARRVYAEHRWLREQVDEAIADRSLFFKRA